MDFFSFSGNDSLLSPYSVNKISFVLFILDVVKRFLSFLFIFRSFYKRFGSNSMSENVLIGLWFILVSPIATSS